MKKEISLGTALVLIVIVGLLVGLGSAYIFTRSNNKSSDDTKNNTQTQEQVKEEKYQPLNEYHKSTGTTFTVDDSANKYNNVFDYISQQNNITIKFNYFDYSANLKQYTVETTNVKNVLEQLSLSSVAYSQEKKLESDSKISKITIDYQSNSNTYYFVGKFGLDNMGNIQSIADLESNDGNVYKILDKIVTASFNTYYLKLTDNASNAIKNLLY